MLIKVKKSWTSDGTIVLEAFDLHNAVARTGTRRMIVGARVVSIMRLPRATPKHEVRTAMNSLKILAEIKATNEAEELAAEAQAAIVRNEKKKQAMHEWINAHKAQSTRTERHGNEQQQIQGDLEQHERRITKSLQRGARGQLFVYDEYSRSVGTGRQGARLPSYAGLPQLAGKTGRGGGT